MAKTVSFRQSIFWFTWRVVLANFFLEGHTVNEKYYCALLSDWLRSAILSNWPGLLQKGVIFTQRKQLLLSAHISHRSSVRPSVHLSVTWVDLSKTVQARIGKSSSSAPWKSLVLGTVNLFHKFEGGHPERGR